MSGHMPQRLQKILSAHGAASRRESERLILNGRVTVNGITAKIGDSAMFGIDEIAVDGAPLKPLSQPVYIMLNKPRGYVTTMSDEQGRKSVAHLTADLGERVYPVGRLDMNSEGLLIMTNDGDFAYSVMHPSHNIEKTYEVKVRGNLETALKLLRRPIEIDSRTVQAISVKLRDGLTNDPSLLITIREGRNRQIRKMCSSCGLVVKSLKRVSIGRLKLGALKPGKWRYLTDEEVLFFIEK